MFATCENEMRKIPKFLLRADELDPNDTGTGNTVRLYDLDWWYLFWILKLREGTDRETTQAKLLSPMIRAQLAALYEKDREKIERLQENARQEYRIKHGDGDPFPPQKPARKR
jgi:hypothetical protein